MEGELPCLPCSSSHASSLVFSYTPCLPTQDGCGECGGSGCGNRGGGLTGDDCCQSDILRVGNVCSDTQNAPCIIGGKRFDAVAFSFCLRLARGNESGVGPNIWVGAPRYQN